MCALLNGCVWGMRQKIKLQNCTFGNFPILVSFPFAFIHTVLLKVKFIYTLPTYSKNCLFGSLEWKYLLCSPTLGRKRNFHYIPSYNECATETVELRLNCIRRSFSKYSRNDAKREFMWLKDFDSIVIIFKRPYEPSTLILMPIEVNALEQFLYYPLYTSSLLLKNSIPISNRD